MTTSNELSAILDDSISRLQFRIESVVPGCDSFISAVNSISGRSNYNYFPPVCSKILHDVVLQYGPDGGRKFLAMLILIGMKRTHDHGQLAALPERVRRNQSRQFKWLASNLTGSELWLALDNDVFQKEFGASILRLYVCGSQMVEYRSGLPKSLIFKDGIGNVFSNAAYFNRIGGFKPFFQIHMHVHLLDQFNEVGRNECYRCCSELYPIHPAILGMFGGSWFYDPIIKTHSPHLGYLQDVPIEGGARLFRWGPSENSRRLALLKSATRRSLANQGLYEPCSYFLVWDRASQLRWANT
jgi:hypothetical protein